MCIPDRCAGLIMKDTTISFFKTKWRQKRTVLAPEKRTTTSGHTRKIFDDSLRIAWFRPHPSNQAGLIFHSDHGSQYASDDFRDVLIEYGIKALMSRRGNCKDNAISETVFGSLKVELLHGQRFLTRCQAKDETIAWLLWYNQTQLHLTLTHVSPLRCGAVLVGLAGCTGRSIRGSAMEQVIQEQGHVRNNLTTTFLT